MFRMTGNASIFKNAVPASGLMVSSCKGGGFYAKINKQDKIKFISGTIKNNQGNQDSAQYYIINTTVNLWEQSADNADDVADIILP